MKRGHYNARAVVLGAINYGESDVILTLLTPEFGKIKGMAKGARKSKRRFVATLDPPSDITILFHQSDRSEFKRIDDSKLVDGYAGLKSDIESFSTACYLLELTDLLSAEGDRAGSAYDLLTALLRELSSGMRPEAASRFFEVRILKLMGLMPHLDGCVVCRSPLTGDLRAAFNSARGGLVCRECAIKAGGSAGSIAVSPGAAKFLSAAASIDSNKLTRLQASAGLLNEADALLHDFIRFHTGKEFKTKRFMESMRAHCTV